MKNKKKKTQYSLEREVIVAVVVLYLLLSGALLAIHYMQPKNRVTETSSSSPSHTAIFDATKTQKHDKAN